MVIKAFDAKTQQVLATKPKIIDMDKLAKAFPNTPIRIVDSVVFVDTELDDATIKSKIDPCLKDVTI